MKQIELPTAFFPATMVYIMENGFIDVCGFDGNEIFYKNISIDDMCKEEDKLIASIGEYLLKKDTNESVLTAGLFNLEEFVGYPVGVVHNYLKEKGWETVECFNDYKYAWIKNDLNKSIIAKIDMVDNEELGNEIINEIRQYDGIYSEPLK
jgi:hypothetical protein